MTDERSKKKGLGHDHKEKEGEGRTGKRDSAKSNRASANFLERRETKTGALPLKVGKPLRNQKCFKTATVVLPEDVAETKTPSYHRNTRASVQVPNDNRIDNLVVVVCLTSIERIATTVAYWEPRRRRLRPSLPDLLGGPQR